MLPATRALDRAGNRSRFFVPLFEHDYEQEWLFCACGHDRLRPIHVVIAALKFGFQFHLKLREIDQVPAGKFPTRACRSRFMLEPRDEMDGVIADFISGVFGFEVKCAE